MSDILGIDLGTSTTCVAVVRNGRPEVIPGARGSNVTPSYIHVMADNRILIGEHAKNEVIADPYNTIWATKRLIGRKFEEKEVQECVKRLPYKISPSESGVVAHGRDRVLTPVNVASLILKLVNKQAAKVLGKPAEKAVITVPASFNDLQRKATKLAGEKGGMAVLRLVNEPTAAALAWGYHDQSDRTVAVYDLGGGTFDVSVLSIGRGVYEVLATRGDSWLGGEDFDNRLVDHIVKNFKRAYNVDIYNDKMAHQRVKTAAEKAKIELSSKESTRILVKDIMPDMVYADVDYTLSRERFESLVEDLVTQTIQTFAKTLEDAEMEIDEVDNVILVGGMTRLPLVRKKIEEFIRRKPDYSVDPDEAVAKGAAIHAASLSGDELALEPPPAKAERPPRPRPAAAGEAVQEGAVPVGEAVAMPADQGTEEAAQGQAAPAPTAKAPLLIDVVSQSVGISDVAGLFVPLLKRNTKLPAKIGQVFTTAIDNQQAIRISVFQGEKRLAKDSVLLGEFLLDGIERAKRGVPQIQVTFNIDLSGIFTVSAKDLKTAAEKQIRVEGLKLGED